MALRRLWNSIRGVSDKPTAAENETNGTAPAPSLPATEAPAQRHLSQRPRTRRSELTREDKKLCRRLSKSAVGSVLEVNVGDGSRAEALLDAFENRKTPGPVRYVAIDQFELGGKSLTLRDFHVRLRAYGARVQMIPLEVDAGLQRVAITSGAVDFILWGDDQPPTERQMALLTRLSHPTTVLACLENERWIETEIGQRLGSRAA